MELPANWAPTWSKVLADHELLAPPRRSLDLVQFDRVRQFLQSERPRVVINTAAFHRVDDCESRASTALQVNGEAVHNLALAAREVEAVLVHYSTDYVFDGAAGRPIGKTTLPRPSQRLRRLQAGWASTCWSRFGRSMS